MSLSTRTMSRLPTIKQGILEGLNREKIGLKCGVTEKTIDRDVQAWVDSGQFETWLKEEFLRLHSIIVTAYPELAYKEVSRIIGRMVTRRIETKEDVTVKHIELSWKHESSTRDSVHST